MTLTTFRSEEGASLLIVGRNGRSVLVDGGTETRYQETIARSLARPGKALATIDRICVRSPAAARLDGIRQLFDDTVAWRVYDYQVESGNRQFPRPDSVRPPDTRGVWFNSTQDLAGTLLTGVAERLAGQERVLSIAGDSTMLASERSMIAALDNSSRLTRRLNALGVPLNPEFMGGLLYPRVAKSSLALGRLRVHVLEPSARSIEASRAQWDGWLADSSEAFRHVLARMEFDGTDREPATESLVAIVTEFRARRREPPTFPDLLLIVEEQDASVLLGGDLHADIILSSLSAHGRLNADGTAHFTLLEHSGNEHNVTREFFMRVTADHYLFATCGADGPAPETILALVAGRATRKSLSNKPFTLWFANGVARASEQHRPAVARLHESVSRIKAKETRMKVRFLTSADAFETVI